MSAKPNVVNTTTTGQSTAPKQWTTKREVALHLRCSIRTVASLMRRGVIPYCKCGHFVRFDLAECDHALREFGFGSLFDRRWAHLSRAGVGSPIASGLAPWQTLLARPWRLANRICPPSFTSSSAG